MTRSTVQSLSALIDHDPLGYDNPAAMHQPDNVETTAGRPAGPGGSRQPQPGSCDRLREGLALQLSRRVAHSSPVAQVNQSLRPDLPIGSWESSGIIDASAAFGPGAFLLDVQAHGWEIEVAPSPYAGIDLKREAGQLMLFRLPGS